MKKQYDTLVLNKLYIPIHIISWKRAISLLYQDLARCLDQDMIAYDYEDWVEYCNLPEFDETFYKYVHSSKLTIAVPDILVLKKYDRLPIRDTKFTRENIFHRDGHICAYCGKKFKRSDLTVDHIQPKSKGGGNSWKNTISACKHCNHKKADKTLKESGMTLLFKPKEPRWIDSFNKIINTPNLRPTWSKFLDPMGLKNENK